MTRYARFEVNLIAFLGAAATVVTGWWAGWLALLPALVALALLMFYRDPPRNGPRDRNLLIAPADGRIMCVQRDAPGPDGCRELRVLIFLSVFDVHVNRAPCAGRVVDVQHRAGRFINALKNEAAELNENNTVTIEPQAPIPGPVRVRQIAGALARRIVCALRPGDAVSAGQRFGMIKLGSQTDLLAPEDARWEVLVRAGQSVRAGRTVIARLRDQAEPPARNET